MFVLFICYLLFLRPFIFSSKTLAKPKPNFAMIRIGQTINFSSALASSSSLVSSKSKLCSETQAFRTSDFLKKIESPAGFRVSAEQGRLGSWVKIDQPGSLVRWTRDFYLLRKKAHPTIQINGDISLTNGLTDMLWDETGSWVIKNGKRVFHPNIKEASIIQESITSPSILA